MKHILLKKTVLNFGPKIIFLFNNQSRIKIGVNTL